MTEMNWYSAESATFGDRLAAAREAQSLSQPSLARKLGVLTRTLEKWENDLSEPRANRLQMLAGILNVSLPWLLTGEGDGPAPSDDISEDVTELMAEIRTLRAQLSQAHDRIAVLEKQLKSASTDRAA